MFGPNSKNFQLPEIEIVRPARKAVPYTIIPIGGKDEVVKWRKEQAILAEASNLKLISLRSATRDKVVGMVERQDGKLELDKTELDYVKSRRSNKDVVTKNTWKDPSELKDLADFLPKDSPTLKEKIESAVAKLFKSAFPDKF